MKCFLENKKGSITPMVSIIMTGILLLNFTMIDVLNVKSFCNNSKRRVNLTTSSIMANFDRLLESNYGLYGINENDESKLSNGVYESLNVSGPLYDTHILNCDLSFTSDLGDLTVLKDEISSLMMFKSWGNAFSDLCEKILILVGKSGGVSAISKINKASELLDKMYEEDAVLDIAINGVSDVTPDGVNGFFSSGISINLDDYVKDVLEKIPTDITFSNGTDEILQNSLNLLFLGLDLYENENKKALSEISKMIEYKKEAMEKLTEATKALSNSDESDKKELLSQINDIKNKLNSFDLNVVAGKLSSNCDRFADAKNAYNEIKMTIKDGELVNYGKIKNAVTTISTCFEEYEKVTYIKHTKSVVKGNSSYTSSIDETIMGLKFLPLCNNSIENNIYDNLPSQEVFSGKTLLNAFNALVNGDDDYLKYTKVLDSVSNTISTFDGILNELQKSYFIDDYIDTYFKNGTEIIDSNSHYLNGEIEYILVGSSDERINALGIYGELFALRTSLNIVHLYTNKEKSALLNETAETLSIASEGVGASVYKAIIAFCWASAESAVDLENLENHKSVPLVKTTSDWNTDINGEKINKSKNTTNVTDLDYGEYLRILLALVPNEIKLLRIQDLLELNLYKETGAYVHIESYKTGIKLDTRMGLKTFMYVKDKKHRFYLEVSRNESY